MKSYPLAFRCYAERDDDQWLAFCIDLTLATQGDTFDDARRKLHEQICMYVSDAIEGPDQQHAEQLLTRKAPLRFRVKYHVYRLLERFQFLGKLMRKAFVEPLNAAHLNSAHPCQT